MNGGRPIASLLADKVTRHMLLSDVTRAYASRLPEWETVAIQAFHSVLLPMVKA
jgi:hypothetical protein